MKNLKLIRTNHNVKQQDVATALNIPTSTYATYEQNRATPSEDVLIKLADFFGCSVDYLLGHQSRNLVYMDTFTEDQQKAISMIKKLDEKETSLLLGYLARMTNTPLEEILGSKTVQQQHRSEQWTN